LLQPVTTQLLYDRGVAKMDLEFCQYLADHGIRVRVRS
jgi:hypothetical protein